MLNSSGRISQDSTSSPCSWLLTYTQYSMHHAQLRSTTYILVTKFHKSDSTGSLVTTIKLQGK